MSKYYGMVIVTTLAVIGPQAVSAVQDSGLTGLRLACDQVYIRAGDSFVKVLENCGEPDYKTGDSEVQQWYYDNSGNPRIVVIRHGKVYDVKDTRE